MAVPSWFAGTLSEFHLLDQQLLSLYQHYEVLIRWNQRMNLTSLRPGPDMVRRHYGESLFFASHLPGSPVSLADIGSGAGFPGIPIAVLQPNCRVTLIESRHKKAVFLKESTRGILNIAVVAERAEDIEGNFDWIVSRAVDPRAVLSLVPRLAAHIGLMLGESDIPEVKKRSDIAWSDPIQLPWGDQRFCVYGCSTWNLLGDVPRETWEK